VVTPGRDRERQLLEEERIAFGPGEDQLGHRARTHGRLGKQLQQARAVVGTERREHEPGHVGPVILFGAPGLGDIPLNRPSADRRREGGEGAGGRRRADLHAELDVDPPEVLGDGLEAELWRAAESVTIWVTPRVHFEPR
jgi:hypothetical protein